MTILNTQTTARRVNSQVEQITPAGSDVALVLPSAANMIGKIWTIINSGTVGNVLVQSSTGALVVTVQPGTSAMVTPLIDSPTSNSHWSVSTNGLNASGLKGSADGSTGSAGYVGELVDASVTGNLSGSTTIGVYTNVNTGNTGISLTAGDWDIYGIAALGIISASGSGAVAAVGNLQIYDFTNSASRMQSIGGFVQSTNQTIANISTYYRAVVPAGATYVYNLRFTAVANSGSPTISSLSAYGSGNPIIFYARRRR